MNTLYETFIQQLAAYDVDGDNKITSKLVPCGTPDESRAMIQKQKDEIAKYGYVKTLSCSSEEYDKTLKLIGETFGISKETSFLVMGILDILDGISGDGINVQAIKAGKYSLEYFVKELNATIHRLQQQTLAKITIPLNEYGTLEIDLQNGITELEKVYGLVK